MKQFRTASWIVGLLVLLSTAAVWAGNTETCAVFAPETQFVDREGNPLDPAVVDAMAVKEMDVGTVLVYRRTVSDAEALVQQLKANGESDPALLAPKTWLMAQAGCRMRPAPGPGPGKCVGGCPGRQQCRRIKKPGKNICTCRL